MKTYVIILGKVFPKGHPKEGEKTNFVEKFKNIYRCNFCKEIKSNDNTICNSCKISYVGTKIHTIRANYPLWAKRIKEVQEGKACLSIREWSGKPYNSKQIELERLTADYGVGIQQLEIEPFIGMMIDDKIIGDATFTQLANNDGLSLDDWKDWFSDYDLSQPLAIIHFTKFRY